MIDARPEELVNGIRVSYDALREAKANQTDQAVDLVLARMPEESSPESTIFPLLPRIQQSIESKTLRYVVFEADVGETHEAWRLLLRYNAPCWIQTEFDLLTSTVKDEDEPGRRLRPFVDKGIMDVAMSREGYYGFPPLIFLYHRTQEVECGIVKPGAEVQTHADLLVRLTRAFGRIEEIRKEKPEFVPAKQVAAWIHRGRFTEM